jgi:hypothetical protein
MTVTTTPQTGYSGWVRVSRTPWWAAVTAPTEGEALRQLLEYRAARRISCDLLVLAVGRHPDDRPGRPRHRPQDAGGLFEAATGPSGATGRS